MPPANPTVAFAATLVSCLCIGAKADDQVLAPLAIAPPQSDSEILGTWEWTIDLGPARGKKVKMTVQRAGAKYSAVLTTPDGQQIKPTQFEFKEQRVKIRIEHKKGFITVVMSQSGTLRGDSIVGEFKASGGPIKKSGKWRATRVKDPRAEK